jgi:hypothetical protein
LLLLIVTAAPLTVGVMDPAEVISMLPALDVTNGVVVAELTVVSAIA